MGRPPGRTDHPPEVKAACMAALLAGQGVASIAREYNLDHSVVSYWKAKLSPDKIAEIDAKKGEHVDNLLYDFLTTTLKALQRQAEVMSDETYLRKQPAHEIGIVFGIFADKVVRLLEAHAAANEYRRRNDRLLEPH